MPSRLHEILLLLFRQRPELAPTLLQEVLNVPVPHYTQARIVEANLSDVQPAEYRADLVVLLYDDQAVLGVVVEVQLSVNEHKRFAWPAYAINLRARERCPVCVLVFAARKSVMRWAADPIDLGGGNTFTPLVIGPPGVPVITDSAQARREPELAVLSAVAHGGSADSHMAAQIALAAIAASVGLDPDRSVLYFDLILSHLSEAARASLHTMDPATYEYQSEFARRYFSEGRAEGVATGRAEGAATGRAEGAATVLSKLLALKFGALDATTAERLRSASTEELERWAEHIFTASSLDEVFRAEK
jgi:hypothetical protein